MSGITRMAIFRGLADFHARRARNALASTATPFYVRSEAYEAASVLPERRAKVLLSLLPTHENNLRMIVLCRTLTRPT